MKKYLTPLLMALFWILSCNSGPTKPPSTKHKQSTKVLEKSPIDNISQNQPDKPNSQKIAGKVTWNHAAKEQKPSESSIQLTIDHLNKVSGTLVAEGTRLEIFGYRERETLRCWIAPGKKSSKQKPADASTGSFYGMLLAQTNGDTLTGSVTMSGNGGKPILKGSFQEILK